MTPITCSIIKQYMWYHNKYKKMYDGKNILVLFFKCTSVYYTIYENLNQEELNNEKKNYSTTPIEHIFGGNIYYTFSFYKINEATVINNLRNCYNIFFIDVEPDKTWIEKSEQLKRHQKVSMFSSIMSIITDILYEPEELNEESSIFENSKNINNDHNVKSKIEKIPSFDEMILQQIMNNNFNSNLFENKEELNTNSSSNIILEDEFAIINEKKSTNENNLVDIIDDELVEISKNPSDRTYANIGTGKKLKFSKKSSRK